MVNIILPCVTYVLYFYLNGITKIILKHDFVLKGVKNNIHNLFFLTIIMFKYNDFIIFIHIIIQCKDGNFEIFSFHIFFNICDKFSLHKNKEKKQ
jgi:hypothetical protein